RHVGNKVFANRISQQEIQLLFGRLQSPTRIFMQRHTPEYFRPDFSVPPFEKVSGRQLLDSVHQSPRAWHKIHGQKTIEPSHAELPVHFRMDQNCLEFGTEEDVVIQAADVKRLYAHPIARQNQPLFRLAPQRDGKHSAEPREALCIPFEKSVKNYFGVTVGMEFMAQPFEL